MELLQNPITSAKETHEPCRLDRDFCVQRRGPGGVAGADSGQLVWGSAGTARATGPAAATGTSVQTIPYTARIYQDQANPAQGTYTDNVTGDVSF